MNNLLNDLQKGYIRMFIVICIWILIPTPILFIVPNESVFFCTYHMDDLGNFRNSIITKNCKKNMGIIYSGAIAAAHRKSKSKSKKKSKEKIKLDPDGMTPYTQEWKDKHLKWLEDGLCGSCGFCQKHLAA